MTDWQQLHDQNKRWRAWMDAHSPFKTPTDPLDTLRYMSEECHEARKCWMVERLPDQPRRQKPDSTIYQELGQAVMLGLTYLPDMQVMLGVAPLREDIDYICFCPVQAIMSSGLYFPFHVAQEWVRNCLVAIEGWPGMDVAHELRECHRRLAWRWASEAWAKMGAEL